MQIPPATLRLCVVALASLAAPASAATFTVTNFNEGPAPGPSGSLRKAVSDANATPGIDTIAFQLGLTGTITLTSGELLITDPVNISGPGTATMALSGNNTGRVFNISTSALISGLTITQGSATTGGGILVSTGDLTISSCVLSSNTALAPGDGGAIANLGALTVHNCTFAGNQAGQGRGGGIYTPPGSPSPIIGYGLFTGNTALGGAAVDHRGAGTAVLTNMTASGNTSTAPDSGIIESASAPLRLEYCTVTANVVGPGSSAAVTAIGAAGLIEYRGTIVANNSGNSFTASGGGVLTSLGHNISSDTTGNLNAPGDQPNTDPFLAPLAGNGGPTKTHALLLGSPAIDAGDPGSFPATDQRGANRPAGTGCGGTATPDVGAFELERHVVTNTLNTGPGSLRRAVNDSNAGVGSSTICFALGPGPHNITLTTGELTFNKPAQLLGPGAGSLSVSGNNASRIFNINSDVTAAISGLTITQGSAPSGGGINNLGTLNLSSCVLSNNRATSSSGGGAIRNDGSLTVSGCSLSGNQAAITGGGVLCSPISTFAVIHNTTLTGNSGPEGSALTSLSPNPVVLTNVTVSGNTNTAAGTGILTAQSGGRLRLEYCTVTVNTLGPGSSAAVTAVGSGSAVEYRGSIVAGHAGMQFFNAGGTLTSLGHNISSDATGGLTATGDLPNTDPLLGPLADNGGPTLTHALLVGSPAIDAGDPLSFPPTDQRGRPRPADGSGDANARADIGAFEGAPPIPGDFNHDGDVDAEDLLVFGACATQDRVFGPPPGCTAAQFNLADHDNDSDADLNDFAVVQRCYAGKNVPAEPGCAD